MNILNLIGRNNPLFNKDINNHKLELSKNVVNSTFLVLVRANLIAQAVTKEIFKRKAHKLHSINFQRNSIRLVKLVSSKKSPTLQNVPSSHKLISQDSKHQNNYQK